MPEYLSPGVYVEEVDGGATADRRGRHGDGRVRRHGSGRAGQQAGPGHQLVPVRRHVRRAGEGGRRNPHMDGAYLSHAVYGYFLNGGGRCYVTRVVTESRTAPAPTARAAADSEPLVQGAAVAHRHRQGRHRPRTSVEVAPPTGEAPPEGTFTLTIRMGDGRRSLRERQPGQARRHERRRGGQHGQQAGHDRRSDDHRPARRARAGSRHLHSARSGDGRRRPGSMPTTSSAMSRAQRHGRAGDRRRRDDGRLPGPDGRLPGRRCSTATA